MTKLLLSALLHCVFGYGAHLQLAALNPISRHVQAFIKESSLRRRGYELSEDESTLYWSALSTAFHVGATIGSVAFGCLADRIGW